MVKNRKTKEQQDESYLRLRSLLIFALGGKCVECEEDDFRMLEFDHQTKRKWEARKVSRTVRIANYMREAICVDAETGRISLTGEIELRCKRCNAKKGQPLLVDEGPDQDF